MQIDFHHAVTYVTARLAGFNHADADVVAYAAQYVDDCTSKGSVIFDNQALYSRISSAHKKTSIRNLQELANHQVWIPFHFLPGNGGKSAGENPDGGFIEKIICRPDSPVAQDMIRHCIDSRDREYGLHLLGITMHVYADTWAHQGFAGVLHDVNEVEDLDDLGGSGVFDGWWKKWKLDLMDDLVPKLGHGRANVFPDMPFLSWRYENGVGKTISRDNTELFCAAANHLCHAMQRFQGAAVDDINEQDMEAIRNLFSETKIEDGEERHKVWLKAIKDGVFSFGSDDVSYAPRGDDSWKAAALGSSDDLDEYGYTPAFLKSNWKRFHDALQVHRLVVLHDILPRYGICAA